MHSIIMAIVAAIRRELQHRHHHNTTQVSTKKERKEWERIKVKKTEKKEKRIRKRNRECRMAGMHQQANPFSPSKSLPFVEDKDSFRHKPFKPVPSKWIISIARSSCEVTHVKEMVPSLVLAL